MIQPPVVVPADSASSPRRRPSTRSIAGPVVAPPLPAAATPSSGASWTPTIAVVIPVLNEESHIRACLESVFAQSYPLDRVEVVVADGGSSDNTREIVVELAARHPHLRLIANPRRNQAAGLNGGISVTSSEVVARLDGHAAWKTDHLRRCVDLMASTGADNVGGRMEAIGDTSVASAVALATGSLFGVGGARFHYATRQIETDTVFLGCFRRSALERVGPFNESFPPHEDYELNHRIRSTGGRIVFSPDIATIYWARTGWRQLGRQYFRYGRAKSRVARLSPGVIRPHHLAPPALVASAVPAAMACRTARGRRVAAGLSALYLATCIAAGARAGRGAPAAVRLRVPLVFPVLHLTWGTGFLVGLASPSPPVAAGSAEARGL
jgi:succinoglycan biosynthesis protein ExoA